MKRVIIVFLIVLLPIGCKLCGNPIYGIFYSEDKFLVLKLEADNTFVIKSKYEFVQVCYGKWNYISEDEILLKCGEDILEVAIGAAYWESERDIRIKILDENRIKVFFESGSAIITRTETINAGTNLDIYSQQTPEVKLQIIEGLYPSNSTILQNNTNTTRIKNDQMYFLPYKERSRSGFSFFSENDYIPPLSFPFESISFRRDDTVFTARIYPSKEKIDSIVYADIAVKYTKKKWKTNIYSDGSYSIIEYKKVKPSQWFKENNENLFQADYECIIKKSWKYYPDGSIHIRWRVGNIVHFKQKRIK